jgi:hypothetical protein
LLELGKGDSYLLARGNPVESSWLAVLGFALVATAGGLAFVAFWHPVGFRENLGFPLAFLTAVAFIVLSFWNLGALNARSEALLNAVKVQDHTASATVSSLAESIRDTYLLEVYGLVIASAIIAYLLLLSRLPELGLVRKRGEPSTDEPVSSVTIGPSETAPIEPRDLSS